MIRSSVRVRVSAPPLPEPIRRQFAASKNAGKTGFSRRIVALKIEPYGDLLQFFICGRDGKRILARWKQQGRVRVDLNWLQEWYRTLDQLLAHKERIEVELFAPSTKTPFFNPPRHGGVLADPTKTSKLSRTTASQWHCENGVTDGRFFGDDTKVSELSGS